MKEQNYNWRFLLGGYDLEMITIRQLLEEHNCHFYDRDLSWGACLSAYRDIFNDQEHFAGIELIEDTELPVNYTAIDHHNEKSHRPSSIEQIATLLSIKLTWYQELVAANDKGYIPALETIGATPEEIAQIRKNDRKAQGVTKNDEFLAERSIRSHVTDESGITIVKSLTPRFSAITDRLYPFNKLLIYNDHELTYFGVGVVQLTNAFSDLIKQRKAFTGGGDNGFFGITNESFTSDKLMQIKEEIISILKQ